MRISDWSSDVCSSDLIGFELVILARILQPRLAGRLDPARIVDAGDRRALQAIDGVRTPYAVQQQEHELDLVLVGDGEKLVPPLFQALGNFLPQPFELGRATCRDRVGR